jgi:solute carrier family 25 (mitochondrial carnitine/acylcarnitine transporter), member 20/29
MKDGTESFLAGCVAGISGCLVGHPFDTMKLMQQTSLEGKLSIVNVYRKIISETGHTAIWRGLGPALTVQVITCGFLFGTQTTVSEKVTSRMADWKWLAPGGALLGASVEERNNIDLLDREYRLQQAMSISSVTCATLSGFLTGGLLAPIVCPLEGFKCRAQVQISQVTQVKQIAQMTLTFNGIKTLYSGFLPSILRCSFGNAAFFGVYSLFQQSPSGTGTGSGSGSGYNVHPAIGGATAGAAFWIAGMPFDVLKSRMQTLGLSQSQPQSMRSTFIHVYQKSGIRGLYAGLPVTLMRAIPMNAAVLFTYEIMLKLQNKQ